MAHLTLYMYPVVNTSNQNRIRNFKGKKAQKFVRVNTGRQNHTRNLSIRGPTRLFDSKTSLCFEHFVDVYNWLIVLAQYGACSFPTI